MVFTPDHIMRINDHFQWLTKCKDCNSYVLSNESDNPRGGGHFLISGDTIYSGTDYRYADVKIINDSTLRFFHYFEVYDYYEESECNFDGFDLGEDTTYFLDVVFRPEK